MWIDPPLLAEQNMKAFVCHSCWLLLYLLQIPTILESSASDADTGGWTTSKDSILAFPGSCNIEVREAPGLTQLEFLDRYAFEKPVVIRGATDNTKRTLYGSPQKWVQEFILGREGNRPPHLTMLWPRKYKVLLLHIPLGKQLLWDLPLPFTLYGVFQNECRKDVLMRQYASKRIRLSSANTHSYKKSDVSLEYYVNNVMKPQTLDKLGNETFYWFGDNNFTEWKNLIDLYKPPPYSLPGLRGAYSFGLAAAGTGVPFHFHGPGFGEVIFGHKRWFLYPPNKAPHFHPNRTTLQWLHEDYPELHPLDLPLDCTIGPGDIIYFPDRWWHATLNIDTSVFISTFLS